MNVEKPPEMTHLDSSLPVELAVRQGSTQNDRVLVANAMQLGSTELDLPVVTVLLVQL